MLSVGIKVVRGPSWNWGQQDGGEGNIGIVVELLNFPKKTVMVKWNEGITSNYRIGFETKYDLRILDNSQVGILHSVSCKECKVKQIDGLRYDCNVCKSYYLCMMCYHSDKHTLEHEFTLFVTTLSTGIPLPKRSGEMQGSLGSGLNYYITHLPVLGKPHDQIYEDIEPSSDEILDYLIKEVENLKEETAPHETSVCLLCDKSSEENVTFIPCNHKLACQDCSMFVKKCYSCRVKVEKRVAPDGTILPILNKNKDRLETIQTNLSNIEDKYACGICMENMIDIVFTCGHRSCSRCLENLIGNCHMCRQPITMIIEI